MHNQSTRWAIFTPNRILMKLRFFTFIFSLFTVLAISAQDDDFGMDFTVGAEKKIRPGMSFGIESEARTQDNTRKIERWTLGGVFDMRLWQNEKKTFSVKASAGWKYMWLYNLGTTECKYGTSLDGDGNPVEYYKGYNEKKSYWRNRHRMSVSLGASYKPNKRWSYSLRETFQYTHFCKSETTVDKYRLDDDDDMTMTTEPKEYAPKDLSMLRSKFTVQYNIRHCPVNPYAAVDYGCGLNYKDSKWKFTAGTDINVTKQHKFEVFYRYIKEHDSDDPTGHLLGLGYNFKF